MFIGSEVEFNAMTKYFYTDLTLPKKRLSDTEMVEINGLYRTRRAQRQAGKEFERVWQGNVL